MAFKFYQGQTFNGAGCLAFTGPVASGTSGVNGNQPDFSQWALTASLYDQTGDTQIYSFTVLNQSNTAVPNTNGLYTVTAPSGDTAQWPIGKAQFILLATAPDGSVIPSDPVWYRITASPLTGAAQ